MYNWDTYNLQLAGTSDFKVFIYEVMAIMIKGLVEARENVLPCPDHDG